MREIHLPLLRCPATKSKLKLVNAQVINGKVKEGLLQNELKTHSYEIVDFVPRFVPKENYANSFGYQWNVHSRTQYDETSEFNNSRERFFKETAWPQKLEGQTILEVGSGSGRFTKEALTTGALVVSCDYSNAVDANYKSNGHCENLLLVQASVYEMPFEIDSFDKVFCIGVIQHTPDPEGAFLALPKFLKSGGSLVTDIYVKDIRHWLLQPKYWIRPFTRGKNPVKLYYAIKNYVDFMWPLAKLIRKIPRIGPALNWKLLVADYSRELPRASDSVLKEWAYLDSMDMLSPMYDYPQTIRTFKRWHKKANLDQIDVQYGYNGIEGRAVKK